MSTLNFFNPFFLYQNKHKILPNLQILYEKFMCSTGLHLSKNDKKLLQFSNQFNGDRCFIIGNGPSLKIEDLKKLKNEITFAANKIYLAYEQTDWRPTFYGVEDRLVFIQNYEKIRSLSDSIKLFPRKAKVWGKVIPDAIYYDLIYDDFMPNIPKFSQNILKGSYWGASIIYFFMQLASYMGFKEMFLLGMDFDFQILHDKSESTEILVATGDQNHFHKDYRTKGELWHVPKLDIQEKAFLSAQKATQEIGQKIYNATRGGKLEIFERINFDKIFV